MEKNAGFVKLPNVTFMSGFITACLNSGPRAQNIKLIFQQRFTCVIYLFYDKILPTFPLDKSFRITHLSIFVIIFHRNFHVKLMEKFYENIFSDQRKLRERGFRKNIYFSRWILCSDVFFFNDINTLASIKVNLLMFLVRIYLRKNKCNYPVFIKPKYNF